MFESSNELTMKEMGDIISWFGYFDSGVMTVSENLIYVAAVSDFCKNIKPIYDKYSGTTEMAKMKLTDINSIKKKGK